MFEGGSKRVIIDFEVNFSILNSDLNYSLLYLDGENYYDVFYCLNPSNTIVVLVQKPVN